MSNVGQSNLDHILRDYMGFGYQCTDPDCELHHLEAIEDDNARDTAHAYFILGGLHALSLVEDALQAGMPLNQAFPAAYAELKDDPEPTLGS